MAMIYLTLIKVAVLLFTGLSIVTGAFVDSSSLTLCDFSSATDGTHPSSKCTGVAGTTMNTWRSFEYFVNFGGLFQFKPTESDASAYLQFGSCYDARGHNSISLRLYVWAPTTLIVDVGVASSCNEKTDGRYSNEYSLAQGWQTLDVPISIFNNMDLSKMYTIGLTGAINKGYAIQSIQLTRKAFISRSRHELYEWVGGTRKRFRFSSFNAADLIGRTGKGQDAFLDPYEQEDLIITAKQMGGRVVRTYTLRVKKPDDNSVSSQNKTIQILNNYNTNGQLVHLDRALDYARKHDIRLIIPFIDNWSWFGGVDDFNALAGISNNHGAFFTNSGLKEAFKNLIKFVINRKNSINGVRYRDDPHILAWQLGNELCFDNFRNDVPFAWTQEMANYIRSIDPNHLIMDGTWSNNVNYNGGTWTSGILQVDNLDIVSAHYLESFSKDSNTFLSRLKGSEWQAYNAGKVFMVDEYGLAYASVLQSVLDYMRTSAYTSGALLWSIRSQAVSGGALTHVEYADAQKTPIFMAYQWPGYNNGPKCGGVFSTENSQVMNSLYSSAVAIYGDIPKDAPPCTHRGDILQLGYNSNANVPSIYADGGCIQTLSHSEFSSSYRTVDLRVRQATGAFTNAIQYSFDGRKFKTIGWVDMTVKEGKFLASHRVPITSSGTTRTIYYRVVGSLRNWKYLTPTTVKSVSVAGVDPAFYNAWLNAQADTFTFTSCG